MRFRPSLRDFGYSAAVDQAIRGLGMARSPSQRPATAAQFGDILRTLERREGFEPTPWIVIAIVGLLAALQGVGRPESVVIIVSVIAGIGIGMAFRKGFKSPATG